MYYPKSQIKPNLYTNGGDYILSTTQENYIGYYFETSNGKAYTGKNPNSTAIELIKFNTIFGAPGPTTQFPTLQTNPIIPETILASITTNTPVISPEDTIKYSIDGVSTSIYSSTFNAKPRAIPQFGLTYPTDQEKEQGTFTRYFCKKNNELRYLEIIKSTYNRLINRNDNIAWDLYTAVSVNWRIKGNQETVFSSNQASVFDAEKRNNFLGFSQYFKGDFLKYYLGE